MRKISMYGQQYKDNKHPKSRKPWHNHLLDSMSSRQFNIKLRVSQQQKLGNIWKSDTILAISRKSRKQSRNSVISTMINSTASNPSNSAFSALNDKSLSSPPQQRKPFMYSSP